MRPGTLRARAIDFLLEPPAAPPPSPAPPAGTPLEHPPTEGRTHGIFLEPVEPPVRPRAATRMPLRAAVLGSEGEAVAVGALLANALRSAAGASTAALAVWAPDGGGAARGGPATLAASRLAARLSARGLPAVRRGRLAWLALDPHPVAAALAVRRAAGALEVPLVAVLAGVRCAVVEGLLAEQDLVVVAAAEPDGALARLAVRSCTGAALACAPPGAGPARWLARAGAAGGRGLDVPVRALVRELAVPPDAAVAGSAR